MTCYYYVHIYQKKPKKKKRVNQIEIKKNKKKQQEKYIKKEKKRKLEYKIKKRNIKNAIKEFCSKKNLQVLPTSGSRENFKYPFVLFAES